MGLSRLDNFLKNVKGEIIYVDSNNIDATDAVENQGNSLARPFKTLQRALIEAARFSYQGGLDNDRFAKTTILLYPGEHYVDNRPGWIPTTQGNFLLRGGVSSTEFIPFSAISNFDLTNSLNDLYKLNSVHGGLIIPRGTSIVGMDLRKTKIIPRYVPNPLNDNIGRSAIFRVTGACYFWQLSILDSDINDFCYKDYTSNKFVGNFSHHKLTCFEYADGVNPINIKDDFIEYSTDRTDLDMYYEKIGLLFGTSSGRDVSPDYPDTNQDIQPRIEEYRIVGTRSNEVGIASIRSGNGIVPSTLVTAILSEPLDEIDVDTIVRVEGVNAVGYDGEHSVVRVINSSEIQYNVSSVPLDPNPSTSGSTMNIIIDTVDSASPYIFNCSLRSVYGLNGLHADGSRATGFKSMVVAQFTGIGLQKDNNAFVKYNALNGVYQDTNTFGNENIHTDSRARFKPDWENHHIKCSNDGYIQVVSVFAIGFAKHFVAESGGDQSINNSNSNFGSHALVASGFRRASFPKDDIGYITHIIPPKHVEVNTTSLEFYPIDINKTISSGNTTKIYLYGENNIESIPEDSYQGYKIGANDFDEIKVIRGNSTYSAKIVMPNTEATTRRSSKKVSTVARTIAGISSISNNILTFTEPHEFLDGESVRIISDNGNLPLGIVEDELYYAITTSGDFTNSNVQIKLAKSLNNALNDIELIINSKGGVLRIESRVSDKKPGETGHPIQWDSSQLNWYITASSNASENTIISGLTGNGATSRSYFERITDTRSDDDRIYKVRYVMPSDSPFIGRPPLEGYALQESNSTIGTTDSEIVKQLSLTDYTITNSTELRNFRILKSATWGASIGAGGTATGIATFTSELPHDLVVGSQVQIVSVASTNNVSASNNSGFNGNFSVTGISTNTNKFSVELSTDPGSFTGTSSLRVTSIPRFKKTFTKDSFIVYRSEEVQEYIQGQQDGIYNLILLNSSNSPEVSPYTSQKFLQPIKNLYPQVDRDNLNSDPEPSISYAVSDTLGKVVLNNPENSETKETLHKFLYNFGSANKINSITDNGSTIKIETEKNHGLNRITALNVTNSGAGYGSGSPGSFYGAELTGGTGNGATALISVNSTGQLTGVKVINGGSGYSAGDILGVTGISTFAPHTEASFSVTSINNADNDVIEITGVNHKKYNAFGKVETVDSPTEFTVTLDNLGYHSQLNDVDVLDLSNAQFHLIGTKAINISSATVDPISRTINLNTTLPQSTVKFKIGDVIRISNVNSNGNFNVNNTLNVDRNFVVSNISPLEVKYGNLSPNQINSSNTTSNFIFHNGYSSKTGTSEFINSRMVPIYGDCVANIASDIFTKTTDIFSITQLTTLNLNIGDYLQINNEIIRIKTTVSTISGVTNIEVFRGVLGSEAGLHSAGDPIKRIKVLPVELRRNSLIRASAHTFEYIGFGPGNYSTAFPEKQDRKLSADEEKLAHSLRYDGGISVFSAMNADGNFYIGNKKINSASGKEEIFDVPVPSNIGETDYKKTDYNIVDADKVSISKSIKVEGGKDSKDLSEFYGPVFFGDKVTSTSTKGLESVSVFLQGDETISRKYTISSTQPTIAGNPGDIVFNSNPADERLIGWIYTTTNQWIEFGDSPGIEIQTDNSSGTPQYLTFLDTLTPTSEIERLKDSSKLSFVPSTGTLSATKYIGEGEALANIHPAALIPRDPLKSNNSFNNYLYETRQTFSLTSNTTISGNSNYSNVVFSSLGQITITSGRTLTISSGTRFVVGEISGVYKEVTGGETNNVVVSTEDGGYKVNNSSYNLIQSYYNGDVEINGAIKGTSLELTGGITVGGSLTVNSDSTFTGSITAVDYNSASDRNLKQGIKVIQNPIDLIKQINGVKFQWKDSLRSSAGVIAQEVEEILPELVSENDRGKSVNYNGIIGLLVECVKQQQDEIERLKNSISNPE